MGIWKKLISGFLAVVMVISILPVQVFAEEEPDTEETTVEATAVTETEETEEPTETTEAPTEEPVETTEEPTEESTKPEETEETEETTEETTEPEEELYALTEGQRSRILSRDDGQWLFPLPQECYANIVDWNGCRGDEPCLFCGKVHGKCTDPDHADSPFGHWGLVFAVPEGTEVYAPRDGVAYCAEDTLILEHPAREGYAYYNVFTGLESMAVTSGADVAQGQVIAHSEDEVCFAMFMAPAGKGEMVAENPEEELVKIEDCGWLEDEFGTGMIVNSPSPKDDDPEADCSDLLENHLGTVCYNFPGSSTVDMDVFEAGANAVPAAEVASGSCGENLTWVLDENGVLTISGTGEMYNWSTLNFPPWTNYYSKIFTVIVDGATSIGNWAFEECKSLSSIIISESVVRIGECVFANCNSLKSVEIPKSVISIETNTFTYATALSEIVVDEENSCFSSDLNGVLFDKTKEQLIRFPAGRAGHYEIPHGVTHIRDNAFCKSSALTGVTIPDSVVYIGKLSFESCDKLNNIVIPNSVSTIEEYAFSRCSGITSITLPESETNIEQFAFWFCSGITNIRIPENVNCIKRAVFNGCTSLKEIIIPRSVTTVDVGAFLGCNSLTDVYYSGTEENRTAIVFQSDNEEVGIATWHYNSTGPVEVIASGTCGANVTWALDANGLMTISGTGEMDYPSKPPWTDLKSLIKSAKLEPGVTSVEGMAFYGCENLESIELPEGVTDIAGTAFYLCYNLSGVELPSTVTEIGQYAFSDCRNLSSISIPGGVTKISNGAFYGCTTLSNVTILDGVEIIDMSAFSKCISLKWISLPRSIASIHHEAFDYCSALTDVYYEGTESERDFNIDFWEDVDALFNAEWHFERTGPDDTDYTKSCRLEQVTDVDYLAFSVLSYDAPPKGWQTGEVTVKEMLVENGKWNQPWKTGISYIELYSHIADWKVLDFQKNTQTGFAAYAFANDYDEVIIAYRGSRPLGNSWNFDTFNDWYQDVIMICGSSAPNNTQFYDAIRFYESIAQNHENDQIAATGHSLGGAWADIISAYSGCYAETFNAISALDVAYFDFPEYMIKNFNGVDNWNFVDHVNRYDDAAGDFGLKLKPHFLHEPAGSFWGTTFTNHSLESLIKKTDGKVSLTSLVPNKGSFVHSTTLKWTAVWGIRKLLLAAYGENIDYTPIVSAYETTAFGSYRSDRISTGTRADSLYGAGGTDDLDGGFNDDTYYYYKGDGLDHIGDIHGNDTVYLLNFNSSDNIIASRRNGYIEVLSNGNTIIRIEMKKLTGNNSFRVIVKDENGREIHYMDISSLFDRYNYVNRLVIACPVNIEIIEDATGNIVQTLQDGELGVGSYYSDYGYFYVYQDENGEYVKVADLFEGYSVRIIGADEGTMDMTVAELVNDELTDTYKLADVPVNTDMVATIESNPATDMPVLVIDDNGDGEADRNIPMLSLQGGENVLLTIDREYLAMEVGGEPETVQATVLPSEWGQLLSWHVENETEDAEIITITENDDLTCTVTPMNPGTAYLVAEIAYNDTVFTARCRIDVVDTAVENPTEPGTVIDKPIEEQITEVKLATASATSELYKTDYAQIKIFMDLEQNKPASSMDAFTTLSAPENNGAAVTGARFGQAGTVDLSQYFDLMVKDDSTLLVVPTDYAVQNPKEVKASYSNVPVFVTVGSTEREAGLIKLTVKKTVPKLKAANISLNSFLSGDSQTMTFTGGKVHSVEPAAQLPNVLDLNGFDLSLTDAIRVSQGGTGKYSGKITLNAEVEGYVGNQWPVTVSVKAAQTLPKLALSASTVTLYSGSATKGLAMSLVSKQKGMSVADLGVVGIDNPDSYTVEYHDDGTFLLMPSGTPVNGETVILNVGFSHTQEPMALKLKVKTADVTAKLAKTSLTLNPDVVYTTPVGITFSPADFEPGDLTQKITVTDKNGNDMSSCLTVTYDGTLHVSTTDQTDAGATYIVHIPVGSKEVKLTVKTLSPDKKTGLVNITSTLKASGAIDLSFPDSEIVIKPTFKNYLIQGSEDFDWEIKTKLGEDAGDLFDVTVDADGTAHVKANGLTAEQLKTQYSFYLITGINGKDEPVTAMLPKLSLKRTTLAAKLSKTSVSLNASYMDGTSVKLTSGTKNFEVTNPHITYPEELDVRYADGELSVKVIPGVTQPGQSYKITIIPDKDLGGKAATLTVKTPKAGKTSNVTAKVKVSGSIDVVRLDTFATVTPSLSNFLGETDYRVEVVDAKTLAPVSGFRVVPQEDGSFRIFADGSVNHSRKYKVSVTGILTDINGETAATAPVYGSLTVKMGSVKLTADKKAVTLYAKDRYSSETVCLTAADKALNGIETVSIKKVKGSEAFTVRKWGEGKYAICFADNITPDQLPVKSVKLTLEVTLKGNNTGKPNMTIPVTVNILK